MQQENESIVQVGKINLQAENYWELLDLNNLTIERPTVLCLSGNGAVTNDKAKRFACHTRNFLDLLFSPRHNYNTLDNIDILSVKYAKQQSSDTGYLPHAVSKQLADAIMPLLMDQHGNRLDLDTAKKNMSLITFYTYCDGAFYLQHKIINCLNQRMSAVGYSDSEIIAINQASSNVAFAPNTIFCNRIPSVNVISLFDPVVKRNLETLLTKEQCEDLEGVYLYRDNPGTLYGRTSDLATAGSIQIITSGLINTHDGKLNEHNVALTARDNHWNLKPRYIDGKTHRPENADCVSQMMAWALCKGVENSLQNFKSEKYVPNTYWQEMMDDFKSIINSYDQEKLAPNPMLAQGKRKAKFNILRGKKQYNLARCNKQYTPPIQQVMRELSQATSFAEVMFICEKYDYHYTDGILPELNFLKPDEKIAFVVAKENKARQQVTTDSTTGNKPHKSELDQITDELNECDKSLQSILQVLDSHDYLMATAVLPRIENYLTAEQIDMISHMSEIKTKAIQAKMQMVSVPTFEEMLAKINQSKDWDAIIDYLKQNNFLGVEHLLPEIKFLTQEQKDAILKMAGITPKPSLQEVGLER